MSDKISTKTEADYPDIDPAVRRASRIKLITIIAVFAVPLILATIYLQVVRMSGGRVGDTSRGQLIQPAVALTEFSLQQQDGDLTLDDMWVYGLCFTCQPENVWKSVKRSCTTCVRYALR